MGLQKEQNKIKELEERVKYLETIFMNMACRSNGLYVRVIDNKKDYIYTNTLSGYLIDNTNYKFELLPIKKRRT